MTIRRCLLASAVLAAALAAVPAHSAPRAACQLLKDAGGDAAPTPASSNVKALDIVSADLATGSKNMVVVLRLAGLDSDPMTALGATYEVSWSAGSTPQSMELAVFSDGSRTAAFSPDASFGSSVPTIEPTVVVDEASASITWTIARTKNPSLKASTTAKPVRLTALAATARPAVNLATPGGSSRGTFLGADSASGGAAYTDRAASCVKGT